MSELASTASLRDHAVRIVAFGTILAILYFARDVLIPITLAVLLSLLLSPLVRALRRLRVGATGSVLIAVLLLVLAVGSLAAVMGVQVVRMAASLPQYEKTIHRKLATLDEFSTGRLNAFAGQAGRILGERGTVAEPRLLPAARETPATAPAPGTGAAAGVQAPSLAATVPLTPIPVELHEPPASALEVIEKVLSSVWVPLETAGIVLVVLVFVLLEHESVRDRFIRIAGTTDLRATTLALSDAGERLSRFFVSQLAVNLSVGGALWLGLAIVGLPHAMLWGGLGAALRFVPYVGIWIAALFSAVLAAAVDPGWSLTISTVGLFVIVELVAGQLVEPQLYGHTTGLSPLSVVIAAIFWSWIWGPVGLIVSTPLTLCLVVAGRHVKALSLLDILLGDSQVLTMSQHFYQRVLSGDSDEIVASARAFLKRKSFATYCDVVIIPALHLALIDRTTGAIGAEQQAKVRDTIVAVIAAIDGENRAGRGRRTRVSVLDASNAGQLLRRQREQTSTRWQGPLAVPAGSVMLCMGLGSNPDDLATELLVRILRDQKLDARHISLADLHEDLPPEATPGGVSMVYLVSAFPGAERLTADSAAVQIRRRFQHACLITVFLPGMLLQPGPAIDSIGDADKAATSFGEAVQICLDLLQERT